MGSESSEPQPTRMSTINNVEDLRNMPPPPAPQMSDIPSQNEQSEFYLSDISMEQGEELVTKDKKRGRKPNKKRERSPQVNNEREEETEDERSPKNKIVKSDLNEEVKKLRTNVTKLTTTVNQQKAFIDLSKLINKLTNERFNDSERIGKLEKMAKSFEDKTNAQKKELSEGIGKKIESVEKLVKSVEEKITSMAINEGLPSDTVIPKGPLWSDIVAPHSQDNTKHRKTEPEMVVITSALSEQTEREKRKRNVIVFGLRELQQSANSTILNKDKILMDQVSELFDKMNIGRDKVESVRRFREKDGNTAPILVRLKKGTDRIKVVTAAKRIKDVAGYLGVFVNLDLTVTERELDKKLRFERDRLNKDEEQKGRHFYYRIRNDQIVRSEYRPRGAELTSSRITTSQSHRAANI